MQYFFLLYFLFSKIFTKFFLNKEIKVFSFFFFFFVTTKSLKSSHVRFADRTNALTPFLVLRRKEKKENFQKTIFPKMVNKSDLVTLSDKFDLRSFFDDDVIGFDIQFLMMMMSAWGIRTFRRIFVLSFFSLPCMDFVGSAECKFGSRDARRTFSVEQRTPFVVGEEESK